VAAAPPGAAEREAGPPNYVGVGALDSGTWWWHELLLQHPAVEPRGRRERELRYFDRFCARPLTQADVEAYHARFPRRRGRIVGEWSPRYLYDAWSPPLLRRVAPEAKLLVLLGDPVERFRSRVTPTVADAAGRGRYASQLRTLAVHFDGENILVQQLERCRRDPFGEYARLLRFLGLADGFRPDLRGASVSRLYAGARRVGEHLKRAVQARQLPGRALAPADVERSLVVDLEPEMRELQELVPEIDLALWPEFAHLARGRAGGPA
jgi:hypothetical protein